MTPATAKAKFVFFELEGSDDLISSAIQQFTNAFTGRDATPLPAVALTEPQRAALPAPAAESANVIALANGSSITEVKPAQVVHAPMAPTPLHISRTQKSAKKMKPEKTRSASPQTDNAA